MEVTGEKRGNRISGNRSGNATALYEFTGYTNQLSIGQLNANKWGGPELGDQRGSEGHNVPRYCIAGCCDRG